MYIHNVNLDVNAQPDANAKPCLRLSQNENGRILMIRIIGVDIPEGSTANFAGVKPDGNVYSKAGTVEGNVVSINEDIQMTAVPGAWNAKITVVNDGNNICTARIRVVVDASVVPGDAIPSDSQLDGIVAECQAYAESAKNAAYGSPLTANTAADMTDQDRVYVYTGSETGYTAGHWYYYDGSAWTDGGVYNAVAVQTDTTLSISGAAADAKAAGDEITALKEEFTALESDGVVPSADQILSDKGVTDSVPYHYRKTGGDGADRLYDQIVGGTVNWNQLIHISQSSASKTENGITFIDNRDGSYTFSTVESGATQNTFLIIDQTLNAIKEDHVFVILGLNASSSFSRWYVGDFYNLILQPELGKANSIVKSTGNGRLDVRIKVSANAVITTPITINPQYIDLTAMFGAEIADYIYNLEQTTAGAGVAFFKALFPNDYYPYNAGELLSVSGLSEHKMVGFNQWDEEWEVGDYKYSDGEPYASSNFIRSKTNNYIPVVPGASYYFNTSGAIMDVFYYDYNKAYTNTHVSRNNQTLTIPNGVYFIRFSVSATTYNHNICINLSDPAKNGTYEPYKAHSYPLDSTLTLRGITKLVDGKVCFDGDTYDADGTVTRRYGVVDLGDQSWIYTQPTSDFQYGYFTAAISGKAAGRQNIICGKYPTSYASSLEGVDKECLGSAATTNFFVVDSAYSDAASFKTAMSGVYIVYELATPTTEEADPYQHLQQCDPNGTEEYVSTGIVPIGHNSFYPENLRAKVEQLPWNFASLIAPTEATFTATRNYVTGDLFIVSNVLYKATSNIANGGTITPSTNCTATTLAEIISALA